MALKIPRPDLDLLARLGRLPVSAFDQFADALREAKPHPTWDHIATDIIPSIPLIPAATVRSLVRMASSLFTTKNNSGRSVEDLAGDVVASVIETPDCKYSKGSEEALALEGRLQTILRLDRPLGMSQRAGVALISYANIFHGVSILSDVRPVFIGDGSSEPESAIVVHHFTIDFHTGSDDPKSTSMSFALDTNDLIQMAGEIKKAMARAQSLNVWASRTGVEVFDAKEP